MSNPVRIINQTFELLAEIEDYESLIFTRRWHKPGEFELKINSNKNNVASLLRGNILFLGSRLDTGCIIMYKQQSVGKSGKRDELITIKGLTLQGLCNRRITIPATGDDAEVYASQKAETIMKGFVANHLVSPTDADRGISFLACVADLARGAALTYSSRYKIVADELEAISLLSGLGWGFNLNFTTKKADFDVLVGLDRTYDNGVNPPAMFSPDFENIESQDYITSDYDLASVAIVAGQGEGSARMIEEVGTDTGIDRFETFIDARDVALSADLILRGQQKLLEMPGLSALEAKILTAGNLIYRIDYDLGDIVTVQNKSWGTILDARITEVTESYDSKGLSLNVVFGSNVPTLSQLVNRQIMNRGGASAYI